MVDASGSEVDAPPPECTDPEDCDDGVYCNGAERCVDDSCEDAVSAVDCNDGVACTDDFCDNVLEDCVLVPNHGLCTDPGAPFCDPDEGCRDVPCSGVEDCDDGVFCNGPEFCDIPGEDVVGSCKSGSPPFCDDTIACTIDVCDPGTDACEFAPDHGLCDDGKFCNGTETCDAVADCQSGLNVDCGPDDACGMDKMCDDALEMCVESPVTYTVSWALTSGGGTTLTGVETLICGDEVVVFSEAGVCSTVDFEFACSLDSTGSIRALTRASVFEFGCIGVAGPAVSSGCSVVTKAGFGIPSGSAWDEFQCCI